MKAAHFPLVFAALTLLALPACDEKRYDFECKGTWGRGDKQLSEKTYRYEQLTNENEATRRCSEDMMKDRPKGGKAAKCECQGE
jgi:hypothetical protein